MAFKLTAAQQKQWAVHRDMLTLKRTEITRRFAELTTALTRATDDINAAIRRYNAALAQVTAFAEDVAAEQRDVYDDRSERWRNSDAGAAALAFVEAWEDVDLDPIDEIAVLPPDAPVLDAHTLDLPTEAD